MRIFLCSILVFLLSVTTFALPGLNEKDKQEAESLVVAAANAVDIRQDPAKPFELKARILTKDFGEGSYVLDWRSRDKWRETITLPKFGQLKLRNGDQSWTQRNPVVPAAIFPEIVKVLGLTAPSIARSISVESVKNVSVNGHAMKCIKTSRKIKHADKASHSEECVDVSTGLLAQRKLGDQIVEFGDYITFETKHFPGSIQSTHDETAFEIRVDSLKSADIDESQFAGIAGVEPWKTCDEIQPPHSIDHPEPEYSESAKKRKIQGKVVLFAVIGTDGKTHDLEVAKSLETSLDEESLKAVRKWNYKPAQCGDKPVPYETQVVMEFHL